MVDCTYTRVFRMPVHIRYTAHTQGLFFNVYCRTQHTLSCNLSSTRTTPVKHTSNTCACLSDGSIDSPTYEHPSLPRLPLSDSPTRHVSVRVCLFFLRRETSAFMGGGFTSRLSLTWASATPSTAWECSTTSSRGRSSRSIPSRSSCASRLFCSSVSGR